LRVDENGPMQIPQFSNNDTSETREYHFNPVIENTEEDLYNEDFTRSEIPSTQFLSSQQLDNSIFRPFTSSFGGVLQKETRAKLPFHESDNYCGNFTTEVFDDSTFIISITVG
jgi:hypothetical protein